MEGYFERVVETLVGAGYRWYETANFCLDRGRGAGRDLRAHHNLGYWRARDYLGLGIGAVSTVDGRRWRNAPRLAPLLEALGPGAAAARGRAARRRDARARAADARTPARRAARARRRLEAALDARARAASRGSASSSAGAERRARRSG